jgi:hypothetical protein
MVRYSPTMSRDPAGTTQALPPGCNLDGSCRGSETGTHRDHWVKPLAWSSPSTCSAWPEPLAARAPRGPSLLIKDSEHPTQRVQRRWGRSYPKPPRCSPFGDANGFPFPSAAQLQSASQAARAQVLGCTEGQCRPGFVFDCQFHLAVMGQVPGPIFDVPGQRPRSR